MGATRHHGVAFLRSLGFGSLQSVGGRRGCPNAHVDDGRNHCFGLTLGHSGLFLSRMGSKWANNPKKLELQLRGLRLCS